MPAVMEGVSRRRLRATAPSTAYSSAYSAVFSDQSNSRKALWVLMSWSSGGRAPCPGCKPTFAGQNLGCQGVYSVWLVSSQKCLEVTAIPCILWDGQSAVCVTACSVQGSQIRPSEVAFSVLSSNLVILAAGQLLFALGLSCLPDGIGTNQPSFGGFLEGISLCCWQKNLYLNFLEQLFPTLTLSPCCQSKSPVRCGSSWGQSKEQRPLRSAGSCGTLLKHPSSY